MNEKGLLTGLWVFMAAGGAAQATDNSAVLLHPSDYKGLAQIKGKIQAIDEPSHRIMLQDSSGQKVTVIATRDTRVTDAGDHAFSWTSLRPGDSVVVYYEPKQQLALQIDRLQTTTESVLGIDHPGM